MDKNSQTYKEKKLWYKDIFGNFFFFQGFQCIFDEKPHEKTINFQKYPYIIISFLCRLVSFHPIFMLIPCFFFIFNKLFESVKIFDIVCLFTWIFNWKLQKMKKYFWKHNNFFLKFSKLPKIRKFSKIVVNRQSMTLKIKN